MVECFPFKQVGGSLEENDFTLFANSYRRLVRSRVPSAGEIYFVTVPGQTPKLFSDPRKGVELAGSVERMLSGEVASLIVGNTILFAFQLYDSSYVVTVVGGIDSYIVERATVDWLDECREAILHEFLVVKRAYRDPETGLLNSDHLFTFLGSFWEDQDIELLLVEVPPRGRNLKATFRNGQKAAAALRVYAEGRFLLHHLGQSVFALVGAGGGTTSVEHFSSHLVQFLKKEGFYKVHIGRSCNRVISTPVDGDFSILDEAWTALQAAGRRGPFSFCDFQLFVDTTVHPLCSPSESVTKIYRKLNRKDEKFCLVKLNIPYETEMLSVVDALRLSDSSTVLGNEGGCLIYLSGVDVEEGLEFAKKTIATICKNNDGLESYAGVSSFPSNGFSRLEALENVQKALLHAAFFGDGHVAQFDAVSLNVSGDIYFGDGDLPRAVKEYKRGLVCNPQDVNLLNSLGVTYALLNKNSLARDAFLEVIRLDEANYMAWYNLGLGAQAQGSLLDAVGYLEKSHEYCLLSGENIEIHGDLELQLGTLHCQLGNYQTSLNYFEKWQKGATEIQIERIQKPLGEAYLGIGQAGMAMGFLQRAHRANEFDFDTLSLLGVAIWEAEEGGEIALSLCRKSVDLAPDNPKLRLRLARVLIGVGQYEEALVSLAKCRGKSIDITQVQLLKAEAYLNLNNTSRVRFWVNKVQKRTEEGSEPYCAANALLESIQ